MAENHQNWLEVVQALPKQILQQTDPLITFEVLPLNLRELRKALPQTVKISIQKGLRLTFVNTRPEKKLECISPITFVHRVLIRRQVPTTISQVMTPALIIIQGIIYQWLYSRINFGSPDVPIIAKDYLRKDSKNAVGIFCEVNRKKSILNIRIENVKLVGFEPTTLMYHLISYYR